MNPIRILVVEDHEPLCKAIRHVLRESNYEVLTATDGVEALAVMEKSTPDLIVADIMMPRMNGYEFYEAVRAKKEWLPIPFIFLTAKAEKSDVLKGKKLGAEDYITKPFDTQELLVAIESRLNRAQALREASEDELSGLKRQIIDMLSHELRTPLTYIQGYTSLALEDIPSLSPEALEEFLFAIKQGANRLTQLVEDALILVRIDTGQAADEFNMLAQTCDDLNAIVEHTVQPHRKNASAQEITLVTSLAPTLPAVRLCDPFFVDAMNRLLDNAIKFSDPDQTVKITTRAAEGQVEIAIQDRGVGIAEGDMPKLFKRFQQIDREKMEQQGKGLGLAIAKELIALHDGEIAVNSKPGEGSTFIIRLPAIEAA